MNSRAVKIAVSLLLTVSLLCCSVSVFADEVNDNPLLQNDETVAILVYQLLKSWGINVEYAGVQEYTENVQNFLLEQIYEFLDEQPSIESILAWCLDWYFTTDFWGNLVVNETLMDDVQAFADWLIGKHNLQDNQTTNVNTEMAIPCENAEGIPIYIPLNINYNNNNWAPEFDSVIDPFDIMIGFKANYIYELVSGYYVQFVFISDVLHMQVSRTNEFITNQLDLNLKSTRTNFDRTFEESTGGANQQFNGNNEILVGYNPQSPQDNVTYKFFSLAYYSTSYQGGHTWITSNADRITTSEFNTYFMPTSVSTSITTGVVLLPDDDPNYEPGDSMTIVDGQPQYLVIEWPESVEVSNLPAIISTQTIQNPEIDQIYTNIPAFFQIAGDTMNGFKQILFRMPDEVLITIYAVLAVGVIFGFLRIMREH